MIHRQNEAKKKAYKTSNISSLAHNPVYIEENQNSRKDWPFVPYKKRNFKVTDEQSSSSFSSTQSESQNNSEIQQNDTLKKDEIKEHIPERQKKIKRCPHVWQFCSDLLENENYNPSIIKWLNKEKGIFKIVKPDQVATLWGAQKNRKTDKKMNYEKMARGMR